MGIMGKTHLSASILGIATGVLVHGLADLHRRLLECLHLWDSGENGSEGEGEGRGPAWPCVVRRE